MANVDAFNEGFDAGTGKSAKKKNGKSQLLHKPTPGKIANPGEFKHGGKVRKTGYAKVHKNEVVLTKSQAKCLPRKSGKKNTRKKVSAKR
jgi:hypothetical protein